VNPSRPDRGPGLQALAAALLVILVPGGPRAFGGPPVVQPLGSLGRGLRAPARLAADAGGRFHVTDPAAGHVVSYDAFGRVAAVRSDWSRPLGIAVDARGVLYVGEERDGSVAAWDAEGNRLFHLGIGAGEFQLPNHLAVGPGDGGRVYVSDGRAHTVSVYDGGVRQLRFGGEGGGDGQFRFPAGVCVGDDGTVYVVDQGNDRIEVFEADGSYRLAFRLRAGGPASGPGGRSQAIARDAAGRLYVADAFQGTVQVIDGRTGEALATIGGFGRGRGELNLPVGLAVDGQGRLGVASANNGRIELFGLDAFLHVTTVPGAEYVAEGTPLLLQAVAGGAGPLEYRWRKDGLELAGGTGAVLSLPSVVAADAGRYSVEVRDAQGIRTGGGASVLVREAPIIAAGPESRTVFRGANVPLEAATRGADLRYQWTRDGRPLPGATNRTLELPDIQSVQAGSYAVIVSNLVGRAVSPPAAVSVIVPPAILEIVSSSWLDHLYRLTFNADPGYRYSIDATTDLVHWQTLTNFTHDAGLADFTDADSGGASPRFYRLRWDP